MGRAALHDADALLDAAVELFAAGGARAVTMAAVARAAGAPNGSVYHRFSSRGALLAALWRRTAAEFEQHYREVLGSSPTPQSAVRAAVGMVEWCERHPARAAVLHAGPGAFEPDTWPAEAVQAHQEREEARDAEMATMVRSVAKVAGVKPDEAGFVLFGLPMAVVGEHLRQSGLIPDGAGDLVGRLTARLLDLEEWSG